MHLLILLSLLVLFVLLTRYIFPSLKRSGSDIRLAFGVSTVAIALLALVSFYYRKFDAVMLVAAAIVTGILGVFVSIRKF
jgi:hypothetical protein